MNIATELSLALHAATAAGQVIAICAASLDTASAEGKAPDWIHLLPAGTGGLIETVDARGPYKVADARALIARSLQAAGGRLPIDENHATDLAAPRGEPAPARGWIVGMEERADGIWGRVEWTASGRELVETMAYRGISPAIMHDKSKTVLSIARASLVNVPNLRDLVALHQEMKMDFMQRIAELLGLGAEASEADIMAALEKALNKDDGEKEAALNAALPKIAKALNLKEGAGEDEILTALQAAPKETDLTALQSELTSVTTQLNAIQADRKREAAEAFVDGAIKEGRVGVKPQRERFIALHQKDAAEAEAIINGMPVLNGSVITDPTPTKGGTPALNAEQIAVAAQLGMTHEQYAEALSADQKENG